MKKLLLLFFFAALTSNLFAQTPNWLWVVSGSNTGYGYAAGLATDTSGNLFISGRTGGGTLSLGGKSISPGGTEPFVGKYDASANGVWLSNNYSYSTFAYADAICVDKSDNSFITSCDGSGDAVYIEGFNSAGNLAWGQISYNSNCRGYGIIADNFGNVYSAGHYSGNSITFGATTLPISGAYAGYLVKQDTAGNYKWATYFSSTSGNYVSGKRVVTDKEGNVYVCGAYQGVATFYSANSSITMTTPSSTATGLFSDFFLAKYDSSGNVLWVTTASNAGLGYNSYGYSNVIAIDSCENIYAGGIFQNTAQFGSLSVNSSGGNDVFVAKFNTHAQQWEWVQTGGSSGTDYLGGITLDKHSDVYVTGSYASTPATFGSSTLSSGNAFVAKYANSNGALQWIQSATCGIAASAIVVNKQGYVYVYGSINGSGTFGSQTASGTGPFIAKIDTTPALTITPDVQTFYCPGSTVTLPYAITGTFNAGNVFTAQLSNDSGSFVAPVTLGDTTLATAGNITITIPANTPAGSNYLIRVVSSNPATSSYASGCGAYLKQNVYPNDFYVTIGGAGVNAKVSNDTAVCPGSPVKLHASGGSSYSWSPGAPLSDSTSANPIIVPLTSQTYTVTVSSGSCGSSTAEVAVTVEPAGNIIVSPVDTGICSGMTVTLNATGATSYLWLPGATLSNSTIANPVASPTVSTTYVVTGNGGACSTPATVIVNVGNSAVGGTVTAVRDTVCQGTPGNLSLTGNTNTTLEWQSSPNNAVFTNVGDTTTKYKTTPLLQTTWYRVVVGTANCMAISDTLQLYVPAPLTAYFNTSQTLPNQVVFNSDSSAGNIRTYHWDFGDGQTSSDSNPTHTFANDTIYYVCLTLYDGSNCSYTFCRYTSVTDAVQNIEAAGNWAIYPNPFGEQLTVSSEHGAGNSKIQNVELYDMLGRVVINKELDNTTNTSLQLDVSSLAKGMYFIMLKTANADYVQKVVKQ